MVCVANRELAAGQQTKDVDESPEPVLVDGSGRGIGVGGGFRRAPGAPRFGPVPAGPSVPLVRLPRWGR
jgi:hypothetical protein